MATLWLSHTMGYAKNVVSLWVLKNFLNKLIGITLIKKM